MTDSSNFGDRWREARPSKAMTFWLCVGSAVLTMIVGFTWGGWVTGGTATAMVEEAAETARAELAAAVCVERFLGAPDAATDLAALKDASSWEQEDLVEEGGWVTLAGLDEPVEGAADLCAERLIEAQLPASTAPAVEDPV